MNYEIVYDEKALLDTLMRNYSYSKEIIEKILNHQLNYYRNQENILYNLDYFYNHEQDIQKEDHCIVLSSDNIDEYLFNKILMQSDDSQNISILVTKNVGRLFTENFNAKMRYQKWKGERYE